MSVKHLSYWSAELWPRLYPIIHYGDQFDTMDVLRYLRTLPSDDRIVALLLEQCIRKLELYGIDHNYVL